MDKTLLARCESETLHLSGAIQPHGTLLALDDAGQVSHVSANIAACFDRPAAEWLGQPLPADLKRLVAELGETPGSRCFHAGLIESRAGPLDAAVSRGEHGGIVLELTAHAATGEAVRGVPAPLVGYPADETEHTAARQALVEEIAALTGFQRVMFYLFREEGDGEVVAEAHDPDAYGSYLGLRFPASDIPQIARALYQKNPWRMIPDAAAEPVPLIGLGSAPPDLTWSDLRSVSPVHRAYLANMGVAASLSFPVVSGGVLVALVAAHHRAARTLPVSVLEKAAARVRTHAFAFTEYQSQRRMRLIDSLQYRFAPVREILNRHGGIASSWDELAPWLMQVFRTEGAMLCDDTGVLEAGMTLEPDALDVLDNWFCEGQGDFVRSSDNLARELRGFPLSQISGVMGVRVSKRGAGRGLRLYLTRAEHQYEVAWGGNPEKPVELHDGELGIAPRRSFEKWIEKRLGYSRPWDNETRLLALKLRELLQHEVHAGHG